MRLLGRRAEGQALDRLLADTLAGRSGVTVLRGEPGVGKKGARYWATYPTVPPTGMSPAVGVGPEIELGSAGCASGVQGRPGDGGQLADTLLVLWAKLAPPVLSESWSRPY